MSSELKQSRMLSFRMLAHLDAASVRQSLFDKCNPNFSQGRLSFMLWPESRRRCSMSPCVRTRALAAHTQAPWMLAVQESCRQPLLDAALAKPRGGTMLREDQGACPLLTNSRGPARRFTGLASMHVVRGRVSHTAKAVWKPLPLCCCPPPDDTHKLPLHDTSPSCLPIV